MAPHQVPFPVVAEVQCDLPTENTAIANTDGLVTLLITTKLSSAA
jgi:hypothetical protein